VIKIFLGQDFSFGDDTKLDVYVDEIPRKEVISIPLIKNYRNKNI